MSDNETHWLYQSLTASLDSKWERYRGLYSNTKGDVYEDSLKSFLDEYFGDTFSIYNKCGLIDVEGESFNLFNYQNNQGEIDLVGVFNSSKPGVVFAAGEEEAKMQWVPFDSVAFIVEVKSKLTKPDLEDDLEKLGKVRQLNPYPERFMGKSEHLLTIDDPILCLVYDSKSISLDALRIELSNNITNWHMVLIVEDNTLIANTRLLPYARTFSPAFEEFGVRQPGGLPEAERQEMLNEMKERLSDIDNAHPESEIYSVRDGLLHFLFGLAFSTPNPTAVITYNSFVSIMPESIIAYPNATSPIENEVD